MELNIYEKRKVVKTYKVDEYDLPFGFVEDLADAIRIDEGIEELTDAKIMKMAMQLVSGGKDTVHRLLKDMFPEITDEEIRKTGTKEIARLLVDVVIYTLTGIEQSFAWSAEKNVETVSEKS